MRRALKIAVVLAVSSLILPGCMSGPKIPGDAKVIAYGQGSDLKVPDMKTPGTFYIYEQETHKTIEAGYSADGNFTLHEPRQLNMHYSIYFDPSTSAPTATTDKK